MKKKYIIPTQDVMEMEAEALLEASLELKNDNATGEGMSRELDIFFDDED